MREEKYSCPDVDCGYTSYGDGECPQCGIKLEKIKGDDYIPMNEDAENDSMPQPLVSDFDDDPDAISWYSDDESFSAM